MPRLVLAFTLATVMALVAPVVGINLRSAKLDAGARRLDTPDGFVDLGEIYGTPAAVFSPQTKFGTSVRLSSAGGSRLAVGAVEHDWSTPYANQSHLKEDCGGVFIYEEVSSGWNLTWFVSGNRHERIGDHISLSEDGSRIAIRRINPNGVDIYDVTPTFHPVPIVSLYMEADGADVTLTPDGSRVIVSSDRHNDFTGRVEIFKEFNGVWAPMGTLDGLDYHNRFGWKTAVSSNGNRIAVSAPNYEDDHGMVQVFDYISVNNMWVQIGRDIVGDSRGDSLGFSMDMSADGSTVIVGSPGSNMFGPQFGKVSVYEITSNGWVLKGQELGGNTLDDKYGRTVAISEDGNRIAASSYRRNTRSGIVQMFDYLDGEWVPAGADIYGEDGTPRLGYGLLGVSMTGEGGRLAAGSVNSFNADGESTGLVRIFGTPPRTSAQPSAAPSRSPSASPSMAPSASPSKAPSKSPSAAPSSSPSASPSKEPSESPSATPSDAPSASPTTSPSLAPSASPSKEPSESPSATPSHSPSSTPSSMPSNSPSESPSSAPSAVPSVGPTLHPSAPPSVSTQPSLSPSAEPSVSPEPSSSPSESPTTKPSGTPSVTPTAAPSNEPSQSPTDMPSSSPTMNPTKSPSKEPTANPTTLPSHSPTGTPSLPPTNYPTKVPSVSPSTTPSVGPTLPPTGAPSASWQPSLRPSATPSVSTKPSSSPSESPTMEASGIPSAAPSGMPSDEPSEAPSVLPTVATAAPNVIPRANSPGGEESSDAGKSIVSLVVALIAASVGVALL